MWGGGRGEPCSTGRMSDLISSLSAFNYRKGCDAKGPAPTTKSTQTNFNNKTHP